MKTAVFGGTFDPVHMGHIKMAQSAIDQFGLDRLVIVPNANPPHKKNAVNTDFIHRYNMLKLAFSQNPVAEISDYESTADKYSYSLHTMRHFRALYGEDTGFIIGADSLCTIHRWYEYETFLKENKFIVFCRETDGEFEGIFEYYQSQGIDIRLAEMPVFDASSTDVRSLLEKGIVPCNVLTPEVTEYIRVNALYGGKI